ncbi:MAG: hypothetical protein WD738_04735 [Pirellulales bacterium]
MTVRYTPLVILMFLPFVCVPGCGRSSQCTVSGKLTFNGQPIQDGSIRFFPVDGTDGHGAVAKIENGQYTITSQSNFRSGKYAVQITALRKTGRMIAPREVMPGDDGSPAEEVIQFIPSKYNSNSELQADLQPGQNSYDLELPSVLER